ncbi:MAG: ParB N-terminal domain-containing protein, partial [Selenomonadaceae bacterium]|nr:ParB N-terminal domain-containing protein [Selenomonadaceae bacterium]
MAGFNMMDLMNNESKSQTSKPSYELREIPIGKLIPNPANAYSMTGIEELANSILLAGRVLQNLVVKPADENGNYMIISGHRRHLASKMLVEQGHNEFATVSALVENERNETLQELMLIYTNSTARELTDAEKMRQATRATELLKSLKEKGQFSERIRDAVAKMLNTTSGQIGRYQAIANNLKNEDLKEKFESGEMGVSAAYEASRLSEEGQKKIAEQMKEGKTVSVHDIKQENPSAGGGEKDTSASDEDNPIRTKKLDIPAKFKTDITLRILEKDGKFYIGADYTCRMGDYSGGCYSPNPTYGTPHNTEQEAVETEIKHIAGMSKTLHKVLWESGYRIVGEPEREKEQEKALPTD